MSAVLAPFRREKPVPPEKFPEGLDPKIDSRLRRGREARDKDKNKRELCRKFWLGDQYYLQTALGGLTFQTPGPAGIVARDKPVNRIRNTYNYVQLIVEGKVSAATQQLPGYEVHPATSDPEDEEAASFATNVAFFLYDQVRLRRHRTKAVTQALVSREGFLLPYFDPNIGPFTNGRGKGEIRLLSLSRDQVGWEPDEDFDDSRWHFYDREQRIEDVKKIPGYVPGSLAKREDDGAKTVTLTVYLERPCPEYPEGRRIFIADGRPVVNYRLTEDGKDGPYWWEPYEYMDAEGAVCDEPALHRISYTVNPDGDDLGLVERIIDLQRTVNDTWNKILEIKNRALHLQMLARVDAQVQRRDDTPGAIVQYAGVEKPEWEPAPDPQLLAQLLTIHREAITELRALASDVDVQPQPRLAADVATLAQGAAQARWASFLGDLADFDSRLMRHCLTLVARYYDEQRQIDIRGQYGWESTRSFAGQDLRSQVNVRVLPGSLAVKSQAQKQQEIAWVEETWPGAVTPEAGLAFIQGGKEEGFLTSWRQHTAKAWRVVQRLKSGPDAAESFGYRFDPQAPNIEAMAAAQMGSPLVNPETGEPVPLVGIDVPGWMPGPQDNSKIWRQVISDYMVTQDFEQLDQAVQENFLFVLDGLDRAEQDRAAKQAAMQVQQAQSLGMGNAAKTPVAPPLPDRAGFTPENEGPAPNAP